MRRDDGLVRARYATVGLAGVSLFGAIAVAGMAHAATVAQRNAQHSVQPMPAATPSPPATDPAQTGAPAQPAQTHTSDPKPTAKPRPTATKPHATSGGS
jgi:outer membrane biosynthesis protein TonB